MRQRSSGPKKSPNALEPAGPGDRRTNGQANASEFAGLGVAMGLAIALFAVGGNWLDGRFGTEPLFVLLGVFVGFGAGFYSMYSRLVLRRRGNEADGSRD